MFARKSALIAVLMFLVLTLVACSQSADPKVSIGTADAGKTITLHQGDMLIVSLEGNITTGFNWQMLPQDPEILKQVGEPEVTPDSKMMGAPGLIVLKFQAVKTGQAKLDLAYQRSFEKNVAPANTFEVTVVVN